MRTTKRRLGGGTLGRLSLAHGLMVLAGLVTFVLVASVLAGRDETVEVWVAATDLAAGSEVDAGDVTPVEIDVDDPLLPFLLRSSVAPDGRIRRDATSGQPLFADDLVPLGAAATGRTFTLPVESTVVDGLGLRVGDRIDVIGVGADDTAGYVVVDAAVARLPAVTQAGGFAGAAARSSWVTIAIDHDQALDLSATLARGEVELVRSTGAPTIAPAGATDS